jgi:endonuclease/exonuclease/phosphatase (EEP) superfamily protein YafD
MRALVAWLLVAPLLAWTAVRLLGLDRGWPLVPLVAFTPYVALLGVLAVAVVVGLRRWLAAAVAAVCAAALLWAVVPRGISDPEPAAGAQGKRLRVLAFNSAAAERPAADLVALARRERVDVMSVVELTPLAAAWLDASGARELLPERVLNPGPGGSGSGIYSRLPLRPIAAPPATRSIVTAAAVQVPGSAGVEVVTVHPLAPGGPGDVRTWRNDLRALPPAEPDGPVRILAGDFNATLDHRELRRLLDTGYVDAAAAVGAGLKPTWPSGRLLPPPVTIDHVLADERVRVTAARVHRVAGSDHRAVVADLVLPQG